LQSTDLSSPTELVILGKEGPQLIFRRKKFQGKQKSHITEAPRNEACSVELSLLRAQSGPGPLGCLPFHPRSVRAGVNCWAAQEALRRRLLRNSWLAVAAGEGEDSPIGLSYPQEYAEIRLLLKLPFLLPSSRNSLGSSESCLSFRAVTSPTSWDPGASLSHSYSFNKNLLVTFSGSGLNQTRWLLSLFPLTIGKENMENNYEIVFWTSMTVLIALRP
jgi:hypothetical protein